MLRFLRSLFRREEKSPDQQVIDILKKYGSITQKQFASIFSTYYARCLCIKRIKKLGMVLGIEKVPLKKRGRFTGTQITYFLK